MDTVCVADLLLLANTRRDLHGAFRNIQVDFGEDGFGVLSPAIGQFDATHFDRRSLQLTVGDDWGLEWLTRGSIGTQRDVAEALVVDFDDGHGVVASGT